MRSEKDVREDISHPPTRLISNNQDNLVLYNSYNQNDWNRKCIDVFPKII